MSDGSFLGWYFPISSMARPSPLGARVSDNDAVVRRPDLAESLQTNLDSHVCGYSCNGVATRPTGRPLSG